MPNSKKTYTLDIDDPLRNGSSILFSSSYGAPMVNESLSSLYEARQKVTISKAPSFDSLQTQIKGLDFEGSVTSPTQGTIFGNTPTITPALPFAGSNAGSRFGSTKAGTGNLSHGGTGQTFGEYFMTNFYGHLSSHSARQSSITSIIFETPIPTVTKDFSTTTDPTMGTEEVKQEFLINFLEKKYEDATSSPNTSELSLPNFYQTVFNGPVPDDYFDDYILDLPDPNTNYENIIIPMDNYDELKKLSGYDKRFPMEIKLSPSNSLFGGSFGFYTALEESNLDSTMVNLVRVIGESNTPATILRPDVWSHMNLGMKSVSGIADAYAVTQSTGSVTAINLVEWARDILGITTNLSRESQNKFYLGSEALSIDIAEGNVNDLQKILASTIFLGKTKEIVQANLLSFQDLNMGKKSYSEIIFYQVEKYESETAPTPIQTFWIPNVNQDDPIEYIDTQVKYNKEYFYKIHALNVVVGTKYYYDLSTLAATFEPPVGEFDLALANAELNYFTLLNLRKDYENLIDSYVVSQNLGGTDAENLTITEMHLKAWIDDPDSVSFFWRRDVEFQILNDSENFKQGGVANSGQVEDLAREYYPVRDSMYNGYDHGDILRAYEAWQKAVDDENQVQGSNISWRHIISTDGSEFFEVDVVTEPTVELIKTELFSFNGSILDDPPMIPHVSFIPYKGIDNKIMINMQAQIGEYKGPPVILSSEESGYIEALRMSRGYPADSMIEYKTDDETGGFEIYRTEVMPTSYEDFSSTLRASTSTLHRDGYNLIYSWGSSYEDTIVSNTVYYYMIRALDIHGHKSYPSPVYRFQMVNDDPTIYPLIDTIEMVPPSKPKSQRKGFKKFIQLVPALSQQMVNYEDSGLTIDGKLINDPAAVSDSISLGIVEPKLFVKDNNKIFKIRLTSKQTGKKLDLNITFDIENESE
tara:strand:+ start:5651 stop:8428 length:2778 start_codon:yes stop_codon:yes gene_type:complete